MVYDYGLPDKCGAWHNIWYGLVGIAWYMVWPGGQRMVYGMACWAQHDIWYGLVTMAWYMLWPGWHHMVYGMAWRTSQGICYGLARYVMAWRGMSWYVVRHSITCFKALSWAISRSHVEWSMSAGGSVHMYRTSSQVDGLLHACSVHTYSSCSLWAGIVDRDCEIIDHCSGIDI